MPNPVNLLLAVAALAAAAVGLYGLTQGTRGVNVTTTQVGATPVTLYSPAVERPGPAVVIAHGFAGSQQLMQPFAVTLARNGFTAVTFDFLGHGRHPSPLTGSITEESGATNALVAQTGEIAAFAKSLSVDGKSIALLGHSMASDIVVRAAQTDPDVRATVAVSMFSPVVIAMSPKNLLVIVGALEPEALKAEARRVVGMVATGAPEERVTYGNAANGDARRFALARGVEHVSVLYSPDAMKEALDWLNAAFARPTETAGAFIDARGPWLALLFAGLIGLALPLSAQLPTVSPAPVGAGLSWSELAPVAILPAVLTPLLLWKAPTDFLPILVGDYLALHFAVYGLLTAFGLWIVQSGQGESEKVPAKIGAMLVAALAMAAYSVFGIGQALDAYVSNFTPTPQRAVLIGAMLAGMLPYFLADEWLTRGPGAPRGAYAATKLCFLASLGVAVALNLEKLFFLIIIVPVILIFFVVYGLFSGWTYRRTNHPFAGAIANALAFAWALAVTFPVLAR
ncbi:MAG: alpha/beta hydrolase [Hyphomicrobium sp.]